MKIKPLHAVILVLGAVAAVFVVVYTMVGGNGVQLADRMLLVDVTTGELFEADVSRRAILEPAAHPESGEIALVRVERHADTGDWYVGERAMPLLSDLPVEPKAIDEETGKVLTPSSKIRRYTRN